MFKKRGRDRETRYIKNKEKRTKEQKSKRTYLSALKSY